MGQADSWEWMREDIAQSLLAEQFSTPELQDLRVWRYFTLEKFIPLIEFGAMWFPRLDIMQDTYEGTLPTAALNRMKERDQKLKASFADPRFDEQFDEMTDRNIRDGRELTVINCWNQDDTDTTAMWDAYVGSFQGLAICSTVGDLARSFYVYPEFSDLSRVKYVDFETHDLTLLESAQAHLRARYKRPAYEFEKEIRISTMNLVGPNALNADASPMSEEQKTGKGVSDPSRPGIYIRVDLGRLVRHIVIKPGAPPYFRNLISLFCARHGLRPIIVDSKLSN